MWKYDGVILKENNSINKNEEEYWLFIRFEHQSMDLAKKGYRFEERRTNEDYEKQEKNTVSWVCARSKQKQE